MRIKITSATCFVLLVMIYCFTISAYAATNIAVSSPHFYVAGDTDRETYQLEAGTIKGQVTINNQTGSTQNIVLMLVLYNKTSGEMKDIAVKKCDGVPLGTSTIFNTMDVTLATDNVLKAYVWSNVDSNSISMSRQYELSDIDIAPHKPTGVRMTNSTYYTLNIAWDEAYDNLGTTSYEVYRDGTLVASPTTTSYKDTVPNYGTDYKYTIRAKDASGNVSDFSTEFSATTNSAAYCIFGTENKTNLLDKTVPYTANFDGGFFSEVVTAGPDNRDCRKIAFVKPYNGNENGAANFLQIGLDSKYIGSTDKVVTIKLTYLDQGTDNIAIQYGTQGNSYKDMSIFKTGTNAWVTSTFAITDFEADKQNSSQYDFRIGTGSSNTVEYVYKVEIFKGEAN